MTAGKKYTQFIFDHIKKPANGPESYGYLGLMYEVLSSLAELRKQKKLSQRDLAQKSKIAQPTIARIESGRGNPTLSQLVRIAHALDHKIKFEPAKFPPGDYEGYME